MLFLCVAAVAAAATHSPAAWFLSGAYHPPLPGKSNNEGLHHAIGSDDGKPGTEISGEALTVALDVVQAWAVLLTLGFTLIIFFFLAFCVCSKKDDGYDEFEISQGITTVKICHDGGENGVSFIPRINGSGTESLKATDETSEASSRYTLKRELPAIPTNISGNETAGEGKSERPVSQHSSDLYASVNDSAQGSSSFKLIGGVQVLPAGAIAPGGRAAVVKESVSSPEGDQIDGGSPKKEISKAKEEHPTFTQVKKSYPYTQVSETEHPYAKVTTRKGQETETDTDSYDDPKVISKDSRKIEPEGRYQSAPRVSEMQEEEKRLPLSSHVGVEHVTKTETVGGMTTAHPPHLTTSIHSIVSTHSTSGHSPTSPHYRSPTSPPQPEAPSPIPAAMAISGRTPANEEMPYMTPPVLQPTREQSHHFSGDSQDSRGYTSISVREPLAALKARQAAEGAIAALGRTSAGKSGIQMPGSEGEGYYMTVSDDSADEMYACIYEGSRGTGSETYAQIEPRTTPSSQAPPSVLSASSLPPASPTGLSGRTPQDPSPPAPPSVDSLRHVVHSRQASASSSASTGMGSPVAEKRGTRSPLPPLPQGDTVLYSPPEPPILSSQPIPKSPPKSVPHVTEKMTPRSLEEMYAKVLKKHPGHSRGSSSGVVEGGDAVGGVTTSRRGSADVGVGRWSATSPTSSKPTQDMTHSLVETRTHDSVSGVNRAKSCDVSSSWGGLAGEERKMKASQMVGNYETIPSLYSGSDPGYETVKNGEPPYASVDPAENYPGYETVRGSDVESEPGYETLKHKEFEPGYETVSEVASKKCPIPSETGYESVTTTEYEPGYESVTTTEYEPGYETVSSKKPSDPGYESVLEKEKLEYDPGYEELSHPVHGRTSSETDPNYEQLKFSSRRSSGGDNGYEVVSKGRVEGNYELVSDYDTQLETSSKSDVFEEEKLSPMPLYASVKKKESPKKEKVEQISSESKLEEKREGFTCIDTSPIDVAMKLDNLSQQEHSKSLEKEDAKDSAVDTVQSTVEDVNKLKAEENVVDAAVSDLSTLSKENLKLADDVIKVAEEKEAEDQRYQVMDSPEEVELPPPGEEDNYRVSPPFITEELQSISEEIKEHYAETETPVLPAVEAETETPVPPAIEAEIETLVPPAVEAEIETPVPPAVEAEIETPVSAVVKTEIETPVSAVVKTGIETPVSAIVKTEIETPVSAVVKTEIETPVSAVVKTEIETPVSAVVKTEIETPVSTVVKTEIETPVSAVVKTEIETPVSAVVKTEIETPVSAVVKTEIETPVSAVVKTEPETPVSPTVEAEPETPVSPAVEAEPETPVSPAVEAEPETPVSPAVEAEPETPVSPAVEAEPETPVSPAVEAEPETPVSPAVEAEPETPVSPAVEAEPETPVSPAVEAKPETPVSPAVEAEPETPVFPAVEAETVTPVFPAVEAETVTPVSPVAKAETRMPVYPMVEAETETPVSPAVEAVIESPFSIVISKPTSPHREQYPIVSLTFTAASPPEGGSEASSAKSSDSRSSSLKEDDSTPQEQLKETKEQAPPEVVCDSQDLADMPSAPSQFDDPKPESSKEIPLIPNSMDDPLPPPPLPALEDDVVTASPPLPPPPIPDDVCTLQDLPPPPAPSKDSTEAQEMNGLSPTSPVSENASSSGELPVCSHASFDLPPPPLPPLEDEKHEEKDEGEDADVSSKCGCVNGNMTVTVNPMAEFEDSGEPPLIPPPQSPPTTEPFAQSALPVASIGESGESQSSGSTVNGNGSGSVESVVTVDPKSGGDPATTVPPAPVMSPRQHSSSTSSSDSKHSDPNEGITPV